MVLKYFIDRITQVGVCIQCIITISSNITKEKKDDCLICHHISLEQPVLFT